MQSFLTLCCFCLPKQNKIHPALEEDEAYKIEDEDRTSTMTDSDDVCVASNNKGNDRRDAESERDDSSGKVDNRKVVLDKSVSKEYTEPEYIIKALEYPNQFNNINNSKF